MVAKDAKISLKKVPKALKSALASPASSSAAPLKKPKKAAKAAPPEPEPEPEPEPTKPRKLAKTSAAKAPAKAAAAPPAKAAAAPPAKSAKKSAGFSDENKSWLQPKKAELFDEEDDDMGDDGDDDELEMDDDEVSLDGEGDEMGDDDDELGDDDDDDDDEVDFERKARQTVKKLEREARDSQAEMETQANQEAFRMPTPQELMDESQAAPDIPMMSQRVKDVVKVLGDFNALRDPDVARADYMQLLTSDVCTCYGYNADLIDLFLNLFSPAEALEFLEANETPRPVTVRTNTLKTRRRELAQALIARNVNLDPIAKWSKEGLQIYESAVPIGATPEYLSGHYMVQSASSFLPVMALAPQPGHRVLDMAASPGGKTTHLAALMGNTGTLVANDFNEARVKSLVGNLSRCGVRNAIVVSADGRDFPKLMGGFDRVLLDAPCTGTGVIAKDPSVKAEKTFQDVQRCQQLQKELLLAAIDSVNANGPDGGYVVYSTCSVCVEENEAVVDYVLASRNVKLVDTGLEFGREGLTRHRSKRFHASVKLCRRYYPRARTRQKRGPVWAAPPTAPRPALPCARFQTMNSTRKPSSIAIRIARLTNNVPCWPDGSPAAAPPPCAQQAPRTRAAAPARRPSPSRPHVRTQARPQHGRLLCVQAA